MTWIRRSPCASPHKGLQFGRLVEPTPFTGYEPKTCIDVSNEHTPINCPSRRDSFNTDYNDLTTTVAPSETPDMKEVGQSISPLLFQEREVSSDLFCVSGFQQQAAASGSQQQASSSVISGWLSADLWITRKLVPGDEPISSVEGTLSKWKRDRSGKCANSIRKEKSPCPPWTERWIGCSRRMRSSEKIILRLSQKWTWKFGNKVMLILHTLEPIENLNLKDWSCIRRING